MRPGPRSGGHEFTSSENGTRRTRPPENWDCEAIETGGRQTNAFRMIEQALSEAAIEREQIDVIAVGLGPGSYTGIRAAISVAQGWQLASEVELLGVSSVEAIAAQAHTEKIRGRIHVVIDAQRGELYRAAFEISPDGWREIEPLNILPLTEAQLRAEQGEMLVGPEVTKWFPDGRIIFPRAAVVAELAARRSDFVPGEGLVPIYLRETNFVKSPPVRVMP